MMFVCIKQRPDQYCESLKSSWWQRFSFQTLIGPRMFQSQMDSFVAVRKPRSAELLGFLIFQYSGDLAGTFDWAVARSLIDQEPTAEEVEVMTALLHEGLNWLEENKPYAYFYFGLLSDSSPAIKAVLEGEGMWLPDYQLVQMMADGPLAENPSLPDDLEISLQTTKQFQERVLALLRMDYIRPQDEDEAEFNEDLDAIAAMHKATLRSAKLFLVQYQGEDVGFVQQHTWKDELRLTFALKPDLWGSATERSLMAALPGQLAPNARRIRLRSFSGAHLAAAARSSNRSAFNGKKHPGNVGWLVYDRGVNPVLGRCHLSIACYFVRAPQAAPVPIISYLTQCQAIYGVNRAPIPLAENAGLFAPGSTRA